MAQSSQDSVAVDKVVTTFMESWNKHDFKDLPSYTTSDFTYITPPGGHYKTRDEVQTILQANHTSRFRNTPLKEESRIVRFAAPNTAVVTSIGTMGSLADKPGDERQIRTFVVVKQNQQWLLTASHTSTIASPAQNSASK